MNSNPIHLASELEVDGELPCPTLTEVSLKVSALCTGYCKNTSGILILGLQRNFCK
jgi:hypothetical protein